MISVIENQSILMPFFHHFICSHLSVLFLSILLDVIRSLPKCAVFRSPVFEVAY